MTEEGCVDKKKSIFPPKNYFNNFKYISYVLACGHVNIFPLLASSRVCISDVIFGLTFQLQYRLSTTLEMIGLSCIKCDIMFPRQPGLPRLCDCRWSPLERLRKLPPGTRFSQWWPQHYRRCGLLMFTRLPPSLPSGNR